MSANSYLLELLDPDQHHALQVWPLDATSPVSVGRARTNFVMVASPLVSRQHARLLFQDDAWVIESLSELGVWWKGAVCTRVKLESGAVFGLGEHGPKLRLMREEPRHVFDSESTIRMSSANLGFLQLDTARRDKEVKEIAESDFFRNLEQRAGQLRARARDEDAAGEAEKGDEVEADDDGPGAVT